MASYTTVGCFSALYFKALLEKRTIKDELPLVENVDSSNEELVNSEVDSVNSNMDLHEVKIKFVFC